MGILDVKVAQQQVDILVVRVLHQYSCIDAFGARMFLAALKQASDQIQGFDVIGLFFEQRFEQRQGGLVIFKLKIQNSCLPFQQPRIGIQRHGFLHVFQRGMSFALVPQKLRFGIVVVGIGFNRPLRGPCG